MPRTAASVADTVGALMPEPVIVIDESSTSGLAQDSAGARGHDWLTATAARSATPSRPSASRSPPPTPRCCARNPTARRWTPFGVVDTGSGKPRRQEHRTTTVPTTLCAVRPRLHGARPPRFGPTPGVVKLAEDLGVAARRVHTADELAHARRGAVIEPGAHLNRRDGALSAALTITGPSTGPLGDTRVRGHGAPAPQGRGAPPPARRASTPPACRG